MQYKVLLSTAGTGSRLGELTKSINKALIKLAGRPAIEYILDSYPKDVPIVVLLGFLGQSVKDYLEANHKDRIFEFVWLDKYEGPGSSLGYGMIQAKNNLQCPFIFHVCDGIFTEKIPEPDKNWIGGFVEDWQKSDLPLDQYRTHTLKDERIINLNDKGVKGFDSVHVGLDGINDYEIWWQTLENIYNQNPNDSSLGDVPVLDAMIKSGIEFELIPYKIWLDTGNIQSLKSTEEFLNNLKNK